LICDREAAKAAFLKSAGFDLRRQPLGGDASTRSYERLHAPDGATFIFMDQPPALETAPCPPEAGPDERIALGYNARCRLAAGRVDAFVACAGWLVEQGLSAPRVLAADPAQGLAVLEDLGDGLFAAEIAAGADEGELYDAAVDALLMLHAADPPLVLHGGGSSWPLLTYDDLALKTAQDLFVEWLPALRPQLSFDEASLQAWEAVWAPIRRRGEEGAAVFCHRDYHAENLIWLPQRSGAARVGLIDFQDAVKAHPAWDLSMLLHDARRDVTPERRAACLDRYMAARGLERRDFMPDFAALGALNVCRIIGVFARLTTRDGKPRYEAMLPRLWGYLEETLACPRLEPLKAWLDAYVPAEARR
jgi:N-acetylmuramate 1-kinase